MSSPERRDITTADGQAIVSHLLRPETEPTGAILIVSAMGVTQRYYQPFAAWAASQGFLAATFDYRGVGLSRSGTLRGFEADILDGARYDCAAALELLSHEALARPLYWVGHSLGGQILPFVPNRDRIRKVMTIATGSGYWRENARPLRHLAWWLWYVVAPLSTRLFGYFPGKRLRKVGDLPRGVMEQWRRWCLNAEYAVGVEGDDARARYAAVRTPIVSLSFEDDEFMSARNIQSIHGFYSGSPRTMKRLAPRDIGVKRIGHFGFFRQEFQDSLWKEHVLPELS